MKKLYFLFFGILISGTSFGQVILSESFTYADGALVGNGDWATTSGNAGDLLVASGQAVVEHGTPSEDLELPFTSVSGEVYAGFDFSVDDLGAPYTAGTGSDFEYFAHMSFRAQIDIVPPTGSGDFSVGISSDQNTAEATWPSDLTFDTTYRVIIKFDQDTGTAELWINPTMSSDTSITGTDDGASSVDTFDLRQSDSDENETIRVDNLMLGQTFADVVTFVEQATCGVDLDDATYTCNATTSGLDGVTVNIAYTGSDATITSVTSSMGTVGGDDPATTADGTITISGLSEGDSWTLTLNGGTLCDGDNISETVPATECVPTCFDLSTGSELFELVSVTTNTDGDEWSESSGTYSMNGFCGGGCAEQVDQWLIFGPLDMTSVTDMSLLFEASESFGTTDLAINYTTSYTTCPSLSTWISVQTITDSGSYEIDMSSVSGTAVYIGIEYSDDGADGYSSWSLSDVILAASNCPTLGTRPTSDCSTLSIAENQIVGFAMYPNPTSKGSVNLSSFSNSKMDVSVYSILGKQVTKETINNNTLDVSDLTSGIYIIKVSQDDATITKKLVIQ